MRKVLLALGVIAALSALGFAVVPTAGVNGISFSSQTAVPCASGKTCFSNNADDPRWTTSAGNSSSLTQRILVALRASSTNVTLSGTQTIDGASSVNGSRYFLYGQTTTTQIGIWIAASGAWTRAGDMPSGMHAAGFFVVVTNGSGASEAGDGIYRCSNSAAADVVGTDSLTFTRVPDTGSKKNIYNYFALGGAPNGLVDFGGNQLFVGSGIVSGSSTNAVNVTDINSRISHVAAYADSNITLSGTGATIDGHTVANGERIAAGNQTTGSQTGIYQASGGGWSRVADMAAASGASGHVILVDTGTTYGGTIRAVTNKTGADVVATNTLTFSAVGGNATALQSATTAVNVSAATAPTSGQVLTATSGTTATWQTPSGGGSVDFASVNAALATANATVDIGGQSFAAAGYGLAHGSVLDSNSNGVLMENASTNGIIRVDDTVGIKLSYGGEVLLMQGDLFLVRANGTNSASFDGVHFDTQNLISAAGASLIHTFSGSGVGELFFGLYSGTANRPAHIGEKINCPGTCAAGDVLVWTGMHQVATAAASANLTTIAGVAVTGGTNADISVARRGPVNVNCETGITGAGQLLGTSASHAGWVAVPVVAVVGGVIGRATTAESSNICTIDVTL